ncbi:alpha/beta hydrolase-fold protein [Streptomyces sp. NPDC051776]|uniref:alpha/beta hydrolase n=1 Tax=Streptomyces sp. NPDC051776 TaxID=3155414 RepID=UPI00341F77FC
MGLTSKKVLLLAIVASIALFTLTVWFWPRLGRRGARTVLARIGVLLATQLSILAVGGLTANNYFGFYSSWADLFGTNTDMGIVVDHGNGTAKRLHVVGSQGVGVPGGGNPRQAGRIDKVQIHGESTGLASPAYVYLPPQYFQKRYAAREFPAAVVLTGFPGTAENLITRLRYPQTATEHIEAGAMKPTILVLMRPTVAPPRDTECVDVPNGPQTESFFTQDVRAAIGSHYRVGAKARSWGVIGNSTGGYCAVKMAMRHPQAFSAAAALSGTYKAPLDPTTGDLFGGSKQLERENDMLWRLDHRPMPPVSVLLASSRKGEHNYKDTLTFISKAKEPMKVSSMILNSGGHNTNTWNREVPPALDWLSNRLSAP